MALSTIAFNVLLHPTYVNLQENVYQNRGQEGYAPMSLKGREVLEGQIVALSNSCSGDGVPLIAYPDAAGMSKDSALHARWMHDVKWAVNQRKAPLEHRGQPMDVTIVPAVRERVLHTGSGTLSVGDFVYVRFPTDADVDTQRYVMRDLFSGSGSGSRQCPPMFATYGIQPGSVDYRARMYQYMDRYKRYLTSDQTDFEIARDGGEGKIAQIELSKVTRITRLLSYVYNPANNLGIGDEIKKLAASIEIDAAGEESALQKCRESDLFKTLDGVQFTSRLLAMLYENDYELYEPKPIAEVLQSLEPGRDKCIMPGEKMAVKLFSQ